MFGQTADVLAKVLARVTHVTKGKTMFMNFHTGRRAAALFLSPAISTLVCAQQFPASGAKASAVSNTVQRSVVAGLRTTLSIQTTPGASCIFRADNDTNSGHTLRLDADEDGVVWIHAKAKSQSPMPVTASLDCTAENGKQTHYPLEVVAHPAGPRSTPLSTRQQAHGKLLPALGSEAESMTSSELVAHGFPPRPDQTRSPGAYAQWKKLVSHSFVAVNPKRIPHPEVRHSPTLPLPPPRITYSNSIFFSNWSGAYMTNPDVRYWDVQADWVLPAVQDVPLYIGYAAAAEWVGLDNSGNDLVQSGTDSESYDISFFGNEWNFQNYSMWIESLPYAPYYLPNFPVSPGDEISVSIFLADQNGNTTFYNGDLTPNDDSVWFMIYNLSTNNSYWGTVPKPAGFSGSTVDFIVEAPQVNGSTTNLADFGLAGMHDAYFADSWFGFSSLDYNGSEPNVGTLNDITMLNFGSGDTLASSYIYPNYSAPGGGNILWVWQNYF